MHYHMSKLLAGIKVKTNNFLLDITKPLKP